MKRAVGALLLLAAGLLPSSTGAAAVPFAAYGADATGTAVHFVSITNALSNFAHGFIDNYFPLASTHMDASPATTAAATVADTGPGGGFLDFEANGKLPQTQYALAGSPGVPSASLSQQGLISVAAATPTSADARAAIVSTTSGGPTAKASPTAVFDTSGDAGESHLITDGTTVKATSSGTLGHVSIGGGVLVIDGLTTSASVVATATGATPSYSVTASAVKVAGQAVGVSDKGIVPVGGSLPTAALNQALSQAGISITTVAPIITHNGANASVDVVGLVVSITAPNPTPSIPTLVTKIILGESRAFAFATAGTPAVVTPPPVAPEVTQPVSTGAIELPPPVTTPPVTTPPVTTAPPAQLAAPAPAASPLRLITTHRRPSMLLWAYLIWQVLIIGNAAVIVWWRRGMA